MKEERRKKKEDRRTQSNRQGLIGWIDVESRLTNYQTQALMFSVAPANSSKRKKRQDKRSAYCACAWVIQAILANLESVDRLVMYTHTTTFSKHKRQTYCLLAHRAHF
jgi:hypothetical protein